MNIHEDMKRLLAEGKTARARQLAREDATGRRSGGTSVGLLFGGVVIVVIVAVIYGMSFVGLTALKRVEPLLDAVMAPLGQLLLSPIALGILGLVILVIGLPRAPRFKRPERFRHGVIALALAFITFWPLQFVASRIPVSFPEFAMALHVLAGFVSICLLTGGLESMRMASNTPKDDSWEFLR